MPLRVRVPPLSLITGGSYTLTAEGGTYTYSGNNANLLYNRVLIAEGGTYNYTGNNADLLYNRLLTADGGTYSYSGNNANLTYVPFSGAYTIIAEGGVYTYSGNNATLTYTGAQPEIVGGHYYEFWRKKWAKQWETKTPDIEEVIEFIEEEPEQAIEVAATVSPKYASIQPETLKINEKLAENIAKQIIVAIKIQQIRIAQEEEDIETLLLIA
jgi:nitrogen regulatory protein PII-like uncharacterized protein